MAAPSSTLSLGCAVLSSLAFLAGAQARFTDKLTPELHKEQTKKTAESQGAIYKTLGISPEATSKLIGIVNLFIVTGLWYPASRTPAAGMALPFMLLGLRGRYISGRSIVPPIVVMLLLVGAMF